MFPDNREQAWQQGHNGGDLSGRAPVRHGTGQPQNGRYGLIRKAEPKPPTPAARLTTISGLETIGPDPQRAEAPGEREAGTSYQNRRYAASRTEVIPSTATHALSLASSPPQEKEPAPGFGSEAPLRSGQRFAQLERGRNDRRVQNSPNLTTGQG